MNDYINRNISDILSEGVYSLSPELKFLRLNYIIYRSPTHVNISKQRK